MLPKKFNSCLDMIRSGNNRGLEEIYYEYYEKMKLYAQLRVNNYAAAEDIASNLLKYILEKANNLKYIENPNAWIYTAVKNSTVNYIREKVKTVDIENNSEDFFSSNNNYALRKALIDNIKNLKPIQTEILTLHYIYGFKYHEISPMLNLPIGTIKSHIFEIKKSLQHLKKF
ncbi:MAG: RNA polymerase sigma factor [Firmicutes bacterium]|nr:RNA polymerase sigma factor [Bacillota bacterium]